VDRRTQLPLEEKTLIDSAKKTSRAIVLDEGYERYGVKAELASVISTGAFYYLDAPVKRMGAMHVPIPFSPPLEDATCRLSIPCLRLPGHYAADPSPGHSENQV
jgi:acetoin:2,6-dichlorophenolindophenol oxidoreductase subunit beta